MVTLLLISCAGQQNPIAVSNTIEPSFASLASDTGTSMPVYGPKIEYMTCHKNWISEYVPCIFKDSRGAIWFATNGDGVAYHKGNTLKYYTPAEGFGDVTVRDIVEDHEGNVWIGTNEGVTRYDGKDFTNFTTKDGLPHPHTWSLLIDKNGVLWVGTEDGLSMFNGKGFEDFDLPFAPVTFTGELYRAQKLVNNLMQDKEGNLWIATNGNGVFIYDGKTITQLTEKDGLGSNFVQSVIQDRNGDYWFGTLYGGVSRYNGSTFKVFKTEDGLATNFVWNVFEDKAGNIWIADRDGVLRYDGEVFTRFNEANGFYSKFVQNMMQDNDGIIWFGTSSGAYRYDGNTFSHYKKEDAMDKGC